ncbi:hypothetical protein M406DRAFT_355219 [Cryphonectria parasitica EP155]|uniref:NADH-ubiquinone oxidoreductase 17.8 kDa subunit n=1 Tax=Cryphonectria parasitica (strain ATCC 38755 / EP155) TaxID=660469 RepID=A0A9P4Y932_CRYP1|nr:uncharacterized protein M406DRAFT_355219 [Cryphonectria parasitica EP155]KAF3769224.1 hypothetical protein M406DRAFT_355219 [Cryphonectria parasitica EP155]
MLAVRQRARRAQPTAHALRPAARFYASDHGHDAHHDHHHAPQVEESPGLGLYFALGALGLSMFTYSISRPGKEGEASKLSQWIDSYRAQSQQTWEQRNTLRTDLKEQAAADRHLFNTVEKSKAFDLRTPELINSGSPHNVPAGHYVNLDYLVEHYRKEHLEEEERKAKKLAEAKKA